MKKILVLLILLIVGGQSSIVKAQVESDQESLIGTWNAHFQQTFLTVSIEADNSAVVYWNFDGSHSVSRTKWKPLKNGLIIDIFPRIRFWKTDNSEYVSVKIEDFDPGMASKKMNEFPRKITMKRFSENEDYKRNIRQFIDAPLPKGWESGAVQK